MSFRSIDVTEIDGPFDSDSEPVEGGMSEEQMLEAAEINRKLQTFLSGSESKRLSAGVDGPMLSRKLSRDESRSLSTNSIASFEHSQDHGAEEKELKERMERLLQASTAQGIGRRTESSTFSKTKGASEYRESEDQEVAGEAAALPATWGDFATQQVSKGFLNILKQKFDQKVRKKRLNAQYSMKMSAQDLFDLSRLLGNPLSTSQVKQIGTHGFISFEEFVHAVIIDKQNRILKYKHLDALKRFFDEYDSDHNGTIKTSEMQAIYKKHTGKMMSREFVKQQMSIADKDGDGLVDFEEYVAMMNSEKEQLVQAARVEVTEQKIRTSNLQCDKLLQFMQGIFRSSLFEHVDEETRKMLEDSITQTERARDSEAAGDFPGLLVHLLTSNTLLKKTMSQSLTDDQKAQIKRVGKQTSSQADSFREMIMKKK